jgi:hypothetical protein
MTTTTIGLLPPEQAAARWINLRKAANLAEFGEAACRQAYQDHMNGASASEIGKRFMDSDAVTVLHLGMEIIEAGSPMIV